MKTRTVHLIWLFAGLWLAAAHRASGSGIPEPDLVIYGTVSNLSAATATTATLVWTNRSSGEVVVTPAKWVVVNDQVFYLAIVPFETRFTGTPQAFPATPNTFEFSSSPALFTRRAGLVGKTLEFVNPAQASYAFGPADRGRSDRVDLIASASAETFDHWIARFPSVPPNLRGRHDDPDGDGVSNDNEFLGGTDPGDPNSVFKSNGSLRPEVTPDGFAGITIDWSSVAGRGYVIERAIDLEKGFKRMGGSIPSAGPRTSFRDPTATGPGPFFYRIGVE